MPNRRVARLLADLAACGDDQRLTAAVIRKFERIATPLDFVDAGAGIESISPTGAHSLGKSIASRIAGGEPEPYERTGIGNSIEFYANPAISRSTKTLIVGFAGAAGRMMLPAATFLQALPSTLFDVVILKDEAKLHYQNGIAGYADTLASLVVRLQQDLEVDRYRSIVTIGASMGGFPALRAGAMFRAARAISFGGRSMWHVGRLKRAESYHLASTFEPLCPCGPPSPPMVCIYSAISDIDRRSAERIAKLTPVTLIAAEVPERHNVLYGLWRIDRLAPFLDAIINGRAVDEAGEPPPAPAVA